VDDYTVSLSKLQRQVLHGAADIGRLKVESARDAVARLNPHVTLTTHPLRITPANARELVRAYDLVADGSDNFATRYAVSDACFYEARPLVTAAVGAYDASLTTLRPHERDAQGRPNPTYRCLFPQAPPAGAIPACAEAGVLGALTGVVGSMMALEVLRELTGFGETLVGRLLLIDTRAMRFETMTYGWDPGNALNGEGG
jgi:adenylyltransferase/sulfurtransferase